MASAYLTITKTTPTNAKKFTFSGWVKKTKNDGSNGHYLIDSQGGNSGHEGPVAFETTQKLRFGEWDGGQVFNTVTDAVFRDTNAWYHVVVAGDSTQATASDRVKIYVNGELQSTTSSYPSLNHDFTLCKGSGSNIDVGRWQASNGRFFDGIMSHVHFIDGTAYAASDFGQTDSTTGQWVPNTSPSVTYGTNGFFLKFENSGSIGTDSSGNGNNLTVSGTMTQTIDTPTHNFCTLNPLIPHGANLTFSNGNLSLATSSSQWQGAIASIAPTGGKYYFEAKYNTGTGIKLDIGRVDGDIRNMTVTNNSYLSYISTGYGYQLNNSGTDYYCNNNTCTTWNSSRGNSTKIIMVALDFDNGKMWVGDSGTWYNKSGTANPETGADPLHDFSGDLNGENWFINMSCEGSGTAHNLNFGGGFFGTTAVSSAGTNASSIGTFEYDVPSGYTALTSKGLNE